MSRTMSVDAFVRRWLARYGSAGFAKARLRRVIRADRAAAQDGGWVYVSYHYLTKHGPPRLLPGYRWQVRR